MVIIVSGINYGQQQADEYQDQQALVMNVWYFLKMTINMNIFVCRMDKYIFLNGKNIIDMIDVVVIIDGCIKTKQQQHQRKPSYQSLVCKDHFVFILFLFLCHGWIRLFKLYLKMVLIQIIVIIFEILSMYIVRNVFIFFQYIFLDGWLFYFDFIFFVFIQHVYGAPTKNASIITTIIIARNNSGVLVTSFIIGVFYVSAGLKDEFLKFFKMIELNVSIFTQHVFKLLLFFQVMFFIMIGFWFEYIKQEQWNQLLLLAATAIMWYFYLSRKDEVNFNCITILKIYLHDLQIFECVRMIVNGIILLIYDILLRYTFFNDLFFYFMVLIFILNDIAATERQETKINKIVGARTTHATTPTNGAPHKNCLSDLLCTI